MYERVLIPTDGSDGALRAARHGNALASAYDATVHVLSVVDTGHYSEVLADVDAAVRESREALEREAEEAIEDVREILQEDLDVVTAVANGVPQEVILEYAAENDVDLVAMGTHGRSGLDRLLIGSVAERVVRTSDAPVLTARNEPAPEDLPYDSVLVPTDGSDTAAAAAEHAIDIAERFGATLHAVNVIDVRVTSGLDTGAVVTDVMESLEATGRKAIEEVTESAESAGVDVESAVVRDYPAAGLREYTEDNGVDLIAMGTHGRSGLDRFLLGSVAERMIRTSEVPVLSVRSPGEE